MSVRAEISKSLNGRPAQPFIDPAVDLTAVTVKPLRPRRLGPAAPAAGLGRGAERLARPAMAGRFFDPPDDGGGAAIRPRCHHRRALRREQEPRPIRPRRAPGRRGRSSGRAGPAAPRRPTCRASAGAAWPPPRRTKRRRERGPRLPSGAADRGGGPHVDPRRGKVDMGTAAGAAVHLTVPVDRGDGDDRIVGGGIGGWRARPGVARSGDQDDVPIRRDPRHDLLETVLGGPLRLRLMTRRRGRPVSPRASTRRRRPPSRPCRLGGRHRPRPAERRARGPATGRRDRRPERAATSRSVNRARRLQGDAPKAVQLEPRSSERLMRVVDPSVDHADRDVGERSCPAGFRPAASRSSGGPGIPALGRPRAGPLRPVVVVEVRPPARRQGSQGQHGPRPASDRRGCAIAER